MNWNRALPLGLGALSLLILAVKFNPYYVPTRAEALIIERACTDVFGHVLDIAKCRLFHRWGIVWNPRQKSLAQLTEEREAESTERGECAL
jgi:hypothetical protein